LKKNIRLTFILIPKDIATLFAGYILNDFVFQIRVQTLSGLIFGHKGTEICGRE